MKYFIMYLIIFNRDVIFNVRLFFFCFIYINFYMRFCIFSWPFMFNLYFINYSFKFIFNFKLYKLSFYNNNWIFYTNNVIKFIRKIILYIWMIYVISNFN